MDSALSNSNICLACGAKCGSKENLVAHIKQSAEYLTGYFGRQITKEHRLLVEGMLLANDVK